MNLGIIGCGKMGQALLGGILNAGIVGPSEVRVFDPVSAAVESTVSKWGVMAAGSNA
ncbi:MAG: NAD(P)-binding domain-containing protein, partial [Verrucomicrobiae bacterium]|nr:NAD(P)-binding domain-containing protein [Verrucomicrobiae bacterium]